MKATSLKSILRHTAAVRSGKVEKTNIIGIRKAINAMERGDWPHAMIDAQFELEREIAEREPIVTGDLFLSGLKVLENPRYRKQWTDHEREIIGDIDVIKLIRFDRVGPRGRYAVPVYRVVSRNRESFAFRNIPWQTAWSFRLDDGPRVVDDAL